MKKDNRIAIYSRKSKFTGKGESIGNQIELCREYVSAHYGEEALGTLTIYEDEGFSGGNLNRPAFRRMMKTAQERRIGVIVVYRLDRISRNISDFAGLIETLSRLGVDFISIREQFDTGTPMGRAMMYIASVFSQLERETIAERIRDNMRELAKTGRWLGGVTPTGYASESVKRVAVDGKAKKTCKLRLIPEEAELVRMIYGLFSENRSLTRTEAELIGRRVLTKNGRQFTRFSIRNILQNPVYLAADQEAYDFFVSRGAELFSERAAFDGEHGILAYNRTNQEKGRATVYLPVQEWIVSVGEHPGLVPGRVWVSVQEALEQNRSKSFRRPRSNEALLTGLLYCRCGDRMYPKLSGGKAPGAKPGYAYVCRMKERSRRALCQGKNVNGPALDEAVLTRIRGLHEDQGILAEQLERHRKLCTGSRAPDEEQLASLRQEKAELERKIDALVDSLADLDGGARDRVVRRIEQMHRDCGTVEARIGELTDRISRHALSGAAFDRALQSLAAFGTCMDGLSVGQRRAALDALVRKVVWDGVNAHVFLHGAPEEADHPDMSPGDGARGGDASKTRWREDSK